MKLFVLLFLIGAASALPMYRSGPCHCAPTTMCVPTCAPVRYVPRCQPACHYYSPCVRQPCIRRVPCPTPVIDPCPTPVIDPCPTPVIDPCPTPEKDLVPPPPDAPIPPVDPTPPADDTPTSSFDDFFNLGSLAGGVGPSTFAFTSGDGATASATATVTVNGETKDSTTFA